MYKNVKWYACMSLSTLATGMSLLLLVLSSPVLGLMGREAGVTRPGLDGPPGWDVWRRVWSSRTWGDTHIIAEQQCSQTSQELNAHTIFKSVVLARLWPGLHLGQCCKCLLVKSETLPVLSNLPQLCQEKLLQLTHRCLWLTLRIIKMRPAKY